MESWFLINCKAGQDEKAEYNLRAQDFEVFRPKVDVGERGAGAESSNVNTRLESLFPRYLFIHLDPQVRSIAPVASTPGVRGPVRFGTVYATASEDLIEQLRADTASLSSIDPGTWEKDRPVRIDRVGFESMRATYCNPHGAERSAVLVDLLGRQARIVVPTRCIRAPS